MGNPIMSSFTIFMFVLNSVYHTSVVYGSSLVTTSKYQLSENFGQDLTELIDKAIQNQKNSISKNLLKEALQWSSLVYYETDKLLDNIEEILPVIYLLNELKPENVIYPKVILSLKYLNQSNGELLWYRMADVYYNLNTNITTSNKSKILRYLIAIITNFVSPRYWHSSYSQNGYCPSKLIFNSYVKEYVNLYFGKDAIPVGLIYTDSFPEGCQPQNNFPVDDLIYYIEIDLIWNFPIFMDHFSVYMEEKLENTQRRATIFIKGELNSYPYTFEHRYSVRERSYQMRTAVNAVKQNQNTTQIFTTNLYQNAESLFNYIILSWASSKNRNVILGNAMQNVSGEMFTEGDFRSKLILPYLNVSNAIDVCDVESVLSKINRFETVLLDERTWRTLARHHVGQRENLQNCNESATQGQTERLRILMHFTDETERNWIHMEGFVNRILVTYPKIGNMDLDTIIFAEDHLYTSVQIRNIANSTKLKYKLGCAIRYSKVEAIFYEASSGQTVIPENDFKMVLENKLCRSMFHKLSAMVWLAPEYGKTEALYNYYSDIFLAREIFLSYFPNITVLIQLSPNINLDKRILADLYNVPIVIPSDEIFHYSKM